MHSSWTLETRQPRVWSTPARACRAGCVREWTPRYEEEGTQRIARGAVTVDAGAWWSVSLHALLDREVTQPVLVRVRLQRHGAFVSPLADGEVEMHVPSQELAAVIVALQGVEAQARRDGIL